MECVQFFLSANGVAEGKHVAVLLNQLAEVTYSLLRNLLAPNMTKDKRFGETARALKVNFEPKPLVIAEQTRREIEGIPMEVDTREAVSLTSEATWRQLFPKVTFEKPKVHLSKYTA